MKGGRVTTPRSLPPRPSLASLRKQAKKLARDRSLSLRDAQLTIAREYGYAGWHDLTAEVHKRLDRGVEWAVDEARRVIHDNDVERLKRLLADYPALLAWRDDDEESKGGLLGIATSSYGDSFDSFREEHFTRAACAELLIDIGALVAPSVVDGLLASRARGLLQLFRRKGLVPRTLEFHAAFGEIDAVRIALDESGADLTAVNEAFKIACDFEHEAVASLLLDRSIVLDPELGTRVDGSIGRRAFIRYFIDNRPGYQEALRDLAIHAGLWKAFVMEQVSRAAYSWSGSETSLASPRGNSNLTEFLRLLQSEPWLLGEDFVQFQTTIIERATLHGRAEFITALLDLDPAILRCQPPPPSQAIEFAFTYAKTRLIPVLTRIWPLPDDLPHAAGMGDLVRVKQRLDDSGAAGAQRVLDTALAWSVVNNHFDVADVLLAHGADINTRWSSHEPASILHELVWHRNYEAMQFLIDRGIDMSIRDYRWNGTAAGWARHAANDEELAQWLENAERRRKEKQ
jgi:ankyrin repeat protein